LSLVLSLTGNTGILCLFTQVLIVFLSKLQLRVFRLLGLAFFTFHLLNGAILFRVHAERNSSLYVSGLRNSVEAKRDRHKTLIITVIVIY